MSAKKIFIVALCAIFSASSLMAAEGAPELFAASFAMEIEGDYKGALNKTLKILRENSKNYVATLRAGWLYYLKKDYNASMAYYQKAIAQKPYAIEPLLGLTLPLMAAKNWSAGEKIAGKIIAKAPNNYLANSRLAYILFSQARYGEAEKKYKKMLALHPGDMEMKLGLAWTYVKMGNRKKAIKYFNEALQVRKHNVNALAGISAAQKM